MMWGHRIYSFTWSPSSRPRVWLWLFLRQETTRQQVLEGHVILHMTISLDLLRIALAHHQMCGPYCWSGFYGSETPLMPWTQLNRCHWQWVCNPTFGNWYPPWIGFLKQNPGFQGRKKNPCVLKLKAIIVVAKIKVFFFFFHQQGG